ncbi:MAG TPA: hypothetical protein VN906_00210 [Candidatus Sulfotelmatobacter sp.]|nr:hypothetical protein [Candidatus Sulfotelmatobacter sp.]
MTAADVRVPRARLIVILAALVVCSALLWLTRSFTFYFDEWTFITTAPDWTVATYFQPHNEHPSILFRLIYSALLHSVGLRSYLPYMALLLIAHGANVVLLFELVRRRAGDLIGVAAAALLLVLGAGWEDMVWAFQMAWLASVAFGLAALLVLDRRPALAAGFLGVSLMFSAIGLFFAVAAAVQLALAPDRRRDLRWLAPVAVVLAAWYVAFGRFANHPNPQPTAANLLLDPVYALWGLSQSAAGVIGEGGWVGLPLLVLAVLAVAWRWRRHGADAFAIGVATGLVAFYLVTGLTRAQLGVQQSGASRYIYVAGVLWLILLADAARGLPWRGTWRPALVALVFLACFNSAALLFSFVAARTVLMAWEHADYAALSAERGDPCLNSAGGVDPLVMPFVTPAQYYRAVDYFGDPATLPVTDQAAFAAALARIRKAGC